MRRLVLSWAYALALAGAAHAQRVEPEAPEVRKLRLEGVKHVDRQDLEKSISTRASRCRSLILQVFCWFSHSPTFVDRYYLDEEEFQRDVLRIRLYYWLRGYRETEVDTTVVRTGPRQVAVTFKVAEGPPTIVRRITIIYDSTLISNRQRNRLTLLRANDPLDLILLDSMRVLFQNELWDKGYGDAAVDTSVVVNEAAHTASVTLTLTPNHLTTIGRVTVAGNEKIDIETIQNFLTFRTGDLYRQSTVLESQRNLYESNLFRLATIDVPPQHDSVKNVNISVTEAPLHEARVGPAFSNIEFLQFQAKYTDYNWMGGARRLDLSGTVGNLLARQLQGHGIFFDVAGNVPDTASVSPYLDPTYTVSASFNQPSLFGRARDEVGLSAFAHRSLNPGVFIDKGLGGQATFTHQVRIRAPVSASYRFEMNRVQASDTFFCVNYGVCDTLTIGTLRSHQSLSPATLTGFIDRSDRPFSPTKGYIARFDFEHASGLTVSDYRYNRLFFDGALYGHQSGTRRVYSAHLRVGLVRALSSGPDAGVLHPRKRFYAGGANSVRGYAENQLGPRILTIESDTLVAVAPSVGGGTCAATVDNIKFCDPNTPALSNKLFQTRPLGGTSLLEGSVEYRVPLPFSGAFRNFVGAAFVDAGVVGLGTIRGLQSISNIIKGHGAITPGIGLRYLSPVGAIRVDVALNPNHAEDLGVVTTARDRDGTVRIVPLSVPRHFVQGRTLLDRIVLHFSIGEAY